MVCECYCLFVVFCRLVLCCIGLLVGCVWRFSGFRVFWVLYLYV